MRGAVGVVWRVGVLAFGVGRAPIARTQAVHTVVRKRGMMKLTDRALLLEADSRIEAFECGGGGSLGEDRIAHSFAQILPPIERNTGR